MLGVVIEVEVPVLLEHMLGREEAYSVSECNTETCEEVFGDEKKPKTVGRHLVDAGEGKSGIVVDGEDV